jgi:thiamine pyrophosphate-dependent acetolactate synthase large subunit-like protein
VERPGDLKGAIEEAMRRDIPVIIDIETDPRRFP